MKNLDIFGNEREIIVPSKKTKTMQEMFGVIEDKQCRTCEHLYVRQQSRKWFKCELWDDYFKGCSKASDVLLKNQACKKYEEGNIRPR